MFAEYEVVFLVDDLSPLLKAGTRGVVLRIYDDNPPGYEVEFFDANHTSIGVETVREWQITKIAETQK